VSWRRSLIRLSGVLGVVDRRDRSVTIERWDWIVDWYWNDRYWNRNRNNWYWNGIWEGYWINWYWNGIWINWYRNNWLRNRNILNGTWRLIEVWRILIGSSHLTGTVFKRGDGSGRNVISLTFDTNGRKCLSFARYDKCVREW